MKRFGVWMVVASALLALAVGTWAMRARRARSPLAGALHSAGYETAAFVGAFPVDARFGLNAGFDLYDDDYGSRPAGGELSVLERPAEQVLNPATRWIKGRKEPWFVWAHV